MRPSSAHMLDCEQVDGRTNDPVGGGDVGGGAEGGGFGHAGIFEF